MRIPLQLESRDDGFLRFPIMNVDFGFGSRGCHTKALIDTGADLLALDERLLQNLGCPRTDEIHCVRTVHGEKNFHRYRVIIEFPLIKAASEVEVTGIDLFGRAYQAILGAPLLELGILHVNPRDESYFELFADRLAPPD